MPVDQFSSTWEIVREQAEGIIEDATVQLMMRSLPHADSEYERGRIAAMKQILGLVVVRPVVETVKYE